jgi:hypothetical protein
MKKLLQVAISALQNLTVEYLQNLAGDLNSPHFLQQWWQQ